MSLSNFKFLIITAGQLMLAMFLYILGVVISGLAIFPGALFSYYIWINTAIYPAALRVLFVCFALAISYFVYGFSLIFILGFLRIVLRLNLREGEYRLASWGTMRWMFINALYLLISITFMDFILLTPIAVLFFRLMGAKVGKNVQINSKYCADLSLLEIGDNTVIGGHATVIGHSFERNRLILKKVKIGRNVVIGLNSVILPGAEIGDGAFITAGTILGKNKNVEPHSVYAGVPGESTKERRDSDK